MLKALLVSLAIDSTDYQDQGRFRFKYIQRRPILGLLYIYAALKSKGLECDVLDQAVSCFSIDDLIAQIEKNNYFFIGFYSQLVIKDKVIKYIRDIKKRCSGVSIIVGGPGFLYYKDFLDNGCDIVCRNEGEAAVKEIVDYLQGKTKLEEIQGIVYKKNGAIIYNKDRELVKDLDSLSFPAWDKIPPSSYYDYSILPMKYPFAVMIASRGCPFRCAFCSGPYFWNGTYRRRSVENVLKEIDLLVSNFGIRYIVFQDEIFGLDTAWLAEFCKSLIARNYKNLHWMCILHPFTLSNDTQKLIGLMKEAGCNLFSFGLQSANPAILKRINRDPAEPKALVDIIKVANKFGIMTAIDFIIGLPGENMQTVNEDLEFAFKSRVSLVNFHPLRIEPASELARSCKDKNICDFPDKRLIELSHTANTKFYFKLQNILNILKFAIKENPIFIFRSIRYLAALKYYLKQ